MGYCVFDAICTMVTALVVQHGLSTGLAMCVRAGIYNYRAQNLGDASTLGLYAKYIFVHQILL